MATAGDTAVGLEMTTEGTAGAGSGVRFVNMKPKETPMATSTTAPATIKSF